MHEYAGGKGCWCQAKEKQELLGVVPGSPHRLLPGMSIPCRSPWPQPGASHGLGSSRAGQAEPRPASCSGLWRRLHPGESSLPLEVAGGLVGHSGQRWKAAGMAPN